MNKILIGLTLIAITPLGCCRDEKVCPKEKACNETVCNETECPKAPELKEVPELAAQQARSIELHAGGKTYPGALLGEDQAMFTFVGNEGSITSVFYSLGGPLKPNQWDSGSSLHLMLTSEVGTFGSPPGAQLPRTTKLQGITATSALQRDLKGKLSACQDLRAACGNIVAKLPPDILPEDWQGSFTLVEQHRLHPHLRRCGSTFTECPEGLTCTATGDITVDDKETSVPCCAKPRTKTCADPKDFKPVP